MRILRWIGRKLFGAAPQDPPYSVGSALDRLDGRHAPR